MVKRKKIDVLIPHGYKPPKKDIDAAWVLARYHKTVVEVLRPANLYKVRTPDFSFNDQNYELKVLTSPQVRELLWLLNEAKGQAENIIVDIRKTKMANKRAIEICQEFMKKHKKYRVSLIISAEKVLDIKV
ncbi:MAG: hypothetical protein LBG75_01360 [Candidatus Nomurabacteria bacterium]|jgi:hypothetical protein|nr:hypothetical protein [Candidatus Nomurabacteria bacterium]